MSQQLQITGGAKVRDLNDVIIGTSGVLSSLAFNVANGVPKLDSNAKILVSQLPNSVMEYQGTWNAATNTPTLTNGGAFNQGDVYLCNVAGTVNFGAGPISFIVGDSAIYSGSIWQRSGGATGSVTSVGLSTNGDSITIGSSPITTSGTITANFNGTNLQYVNGAGNLTTFPTLISSIGLSMPSAFSVSNSPLTANGTIAVTGAGYPSQYIRGDGTLADFPSSGGGGSSVSYYLNGGTSQGTIGGVTYYEMSKTADTGTGVDFPKTGDGLIVSFLTDAGDPAQLNIPAGNWNYEIYASMSANGGTPQMYAELYVYDGTTFTLIATSSNEILYDGTNLNLYTFGMTVPATTLALTDRLAVKLYATNSGGKTTTVHTQDSHLCQIITTFSTGITALNGLTAQVQYFATGTSGTDFNISSTTATHTFNLPVASATNTGKLSNTDWSTFNNKVPYTGATASVNLGAFGITASSLLVSNNSTFNSNLLIKKVGLAVTTPTYVTQFAASSGVGIGYSDGTGGANFILQTASIYDYTFPAATGTVALLESTQTFSGTNTFSAPNNFDNVIRLKQNLPIFSTSSGYTTLFSTQGGGAYGFGFYNGGGTANFLNFPTATANIYTFPSASGTLALTSDLGSYVPTTRTISTTAPLQGGGDLSANRTLSITQATTSTNGYLSSTDWNTFNGKQNALTNPVTGTGTSGQVTYFNGTTSVTSSGSLTWDNTNSALSSPVYYALNTTGAAFNLSSNTDNVGKIQNVTTTSWSLAYGTGNLTYPKGTNVLTWNTSGQVGIGNSSPSYTLDVSGTGRFTGTLIAANSLLVNATAQNGTDSKIYVKQSSDSSFRGVNIVSSTSAEYVGGMFMDGSGNFNIAQSYLGSGSYQSLTFLTSGTERMRITSGGNVGIGTSSPDSKLQVAGSCKIDSALTCVSEIVLGSNGSYPVGGVGFRNDGTNLNIYYGANNCIFKDVTNVERMRITSGGNVCINSTRATAALVIDSNLNALTGIDMRDTGTTGGAYIFFQNSAGNQSGIITHSGTTSITYTSTSDYRLKENVKTIENGLDRVLNLKPVTYTWIDTDNEQGEGFLAHELQEIVPLAVVGQKDELKEDGSIKPQSIDNSRIVPILVKAIQEQNQLITSLQEQINELKNK